MPPYERSSVKAWRVLSAMPSIKLSGISENQGKLIMLS